jgi:hypothetical protein
MQAEITHRMRRHIETAATISHRLRSGRNHEDGLALDLGLFAATIEDEAVRHLQAVREAINTPLRPNDEIVALVRAALQ